MVTPVFQLRKRWHREVKPPVPGHTASTRQSGGLSAGCLAPEATPVAPAVEGLMRKSPGERLAPCEARQPFTQCVCLQALTRSVSTPLGRDSEKGLAVSCWENVLEAADT